MVEDGIADITPGDGIEWLPEYEIGVDYIDKAHQELFRITRRLSLLSHDPAKHKWVADEGIKYLKSYTAKHFSQEEAHMREIKYPHIDGHIEQHILMRDTILPRMERHLRSEKFSAEAIEQFLHIIRIWLSRHIAGYDVAIRRWSRV